MPSPRSHYLSSVLHDLLADLARDELRAQERAAQLEAQLRLAQEATTCSSMHTIRRMQSSLARAVLHAYASVRPTEPSSMMAEPLMAEPLPHTASMEAFALWMQELLSDRVRMDVNQTPIELPRPTSASGSELQLSEQLGGALRAARLEGALSSTRSMSQKMVQDLLTGLAKTFVETYLRRIGGSPGDVDMLLATNEWQHLLTESSAAFVTRRARLKLMDPGTHAVSIPILDPYFWVADDEDDPSSTADPSGQGNLLSRASVSSLWSAPEGAWRAEGSWADERPFGSPLHPRRPASAVVMSRTPTRVVSLADVWSTSSMPRIPKPRTLSTDVRDKCTPLLLSPYQTWRNARSPTLIKQPNKQRADKVHVLGQGQRDGSTVVADRPQRLQTGSKRISDGITQALDGPILEQLALGCLEVATDKVTASMAEKQFIDGELTRTRDALPAESQESDQRVRQGVRVEDQAVNLMFSAGARVSQSRTPPPSPGEKQPISPFLKRASSVPLLVKAEQKGEKDKKLCHEHNVLSRTASTLSESIAATRAASRLAGGRPAAAMPPGGKDQGGSQSWQTLQGKPYDETRNGRRSLPGRRSPPPSETKPTQPKVLLEDYIAKRVALGLPEPMSTKSPKVLLEEYLAQKALKRASTMGVLMLMTTSPTVTELDSRLESNRAEGIDRVIVLVRLQTRLRGWCARHRRDKVTLLVARQEAAKRVLTSWAKRRYLRSSIWRLWHRQMAAAVETIMQRFTEAYDPTLSEDEVARKGLRRVDALAMLKKGLGRQHENAHAIADALEEYCKLGGVDAKVKRGAERFLNALGADLPENSHLPAMRRMYKKDQPHALRIFFSSTFRDMDGEREFFARRYAAELRTLARAQGVFVTFVDLGAGSTPHAESSQEEVVHIGFKLLKQSRYFVHFIGSRYGWRPSIEELKKDTVQEFDCLRTYIPGRSITEVEVVYGALGWGPQSACSPKNAFFYIRSNKFCNNIPLKAKDDYVDGDPCVQSRLADLKLRIRARAAESNKHHGKAISGASLPFVECCRDYERPEDFAKLLFDDLRAAILRDYPEKKIFSALDEQFMRHIQVASQHCDVYVGHESVQQQIDEYIASAGTTGPRTPLILAGIAGSGKSAALANWLFRTSIVGFVFPHFCSATETSNSHDGILLRLASELKRSFGFEHDLPADKDELIELIPKWVTLACTSTPVVVILDGIDQLAETEARALAWLPNALPRNFSLLLSTSNDPLVLKSCASRGWNNIITMPKLSVADQDKLTADLLAWHNTTLESHLLLMLTKTTKTTSPLFLRMAIELLVVNDVATENSTTDGFSLQSLLSSCLQRPSASELAKFVLLRLETRYGKQLIQSVFSYLEASRFGMSEVEMIELLKMNQADWCFLFTAIRTLLCESVGLLIISGRVMRQAVRKRYFLDEAYVVAIHRELIDFFRTLSSSTMSDSVRIRCCTELPFHMIHAHELDMLSDYLLDVGRVRHLLMDSCLSRELTSLWAQIGSDRVQQHGSQYVDSLAQCEKELRKEMATSFKMLGQSRKDIKHASLELLARIAGHLGSFLCESYQYHAAAALHKRAIEIDRGLIDDFGERVPEGFRLLANTQSLMGAYVDAISNYFMAAGIYAHCAKTQPSARIEYAQTLFEIAGVARYVEEETVVTVSGENVFLKDKARRQCLSALRTFQDVLGDHSPRVRIKRSSATD